MQKEKKLLVDPLPQFLGLFSWVIQFWISVRLMVSLLEPRFYNSKKYFRIKGIFDILTNIKLNIIHSHYFHVALVGRKVKKVFRILLIYATLVTVYGIKTLYNLSRVLQIIAWPIFV